MTGANKLGSPRAHWENLDRGWQGLVLESKDVAVILLPGKGCDVYSWTDLRSGVDVLFKSPWGLPPPVPAMTPGDSMTAWLERYPGGWQVLCPNGGSASEVPGGGQWGFHGEACLTAWSVDDQGADGAAAWASLSTRLARAPLALSRRVRVEGRRLTLEESVTNTSPDALEFMWSHHPAFGAPFLEKGCVVTAGARTVVADDEAPGTLLEKDSRYGWPDARDRQGETLDLSRIPGPSEVRAHLAYLTDFEDGWFAISNPRLGLGVRLRWPVDVFPYAWFWQEIHATRGYPWWRQAYVCAVEPASTIPGQGVDAARRKGGRLVRLAGGESRSVVMEASMVEEGQV